MESKASHFKPAPSWYRGKDWESLTLGARLNLAFAQAHQELSSKLPAKELWENREFYARTLDFLCGYFRCVVLDHLLDIGGGHGLISLLWLAHGTARTASIVDRRRPASYHVLCARFREVVEFHPPDFLEQRLDQIRSLAWPERTALVGVHCCGTLTEALIKLALRLEKPFAVLPCCHGAGEKDQAFVEMLKAAAHRKRLSYFDAYDLVRLGTIRAAGWKASFATISPYISPRNNILLGCPPRR